MKIWIMFVLFAALVPPASAFSQFDRQVRRLYSETIRTEMVPKISMEEYTLRYRLPLPSAYDPSNASLLEIAGVEQARVEAIKMYRMKSNLQRNNWNSVLPEVEKDIHAILQIEKATKGRQVTLQERQQVDQLTRDIDQKYTDFFVAIASKSNRTADGSMEVRSYPISIYSKPDGAFAQECERGTYLLHKYYKREIPWKTVRLGTGGHYSYGRVIMRAKWPDQSGFSDLDWTHRRDRVVELHPTGPIDSGSEENYPHPNIGMYIP